MAISVVKMVFVSVGLCCILMDLNFGVTSIGTQCNAGCVLFVPRLV